MWLPLELARTYERAERQREAEAAYWECLRLDPGNSPAANACPIAPSCGAISVTYPERPGGADEIVA